MRRGVDAGAWIKTWRRRCDKPYRGRGAQREGVEGPTHHRACVATHTTYEWTPHHAVVGVHSCFGGARVPLQLPGLMAALGTPGAGGSS
jgi:hypothetical protein